MTAKVMCTFKAVSTQKLKAWKAVILYEAKGLLLQRVAWIGLPSLLSDVTFIERLCSIYRAANTTVVL